MQLSLPLPEEVKKCLSKVVKNLLSIVDLSYRSNILRSAVSTYVVNPGKLVRPTLTILTSYLLGGDLEAAVYAATAVECVHIAALLQDDVFDKHKIRRGVATPAAVHGEFFSILASNIFIAKAVEFCTYTRIPEILLEIAHAAVRLTDGESKELELRREGRRVTLREYFDIILGKTASLIEASLAVGAYTARVDKDKMRKIRLIGRLLGLAYQLRDDLIDYVMADPRNPPSLPETINIVYVLENEHGRECAIKRALTMFRNTIRLVKNLIWQVFDKSGFIFASLIEKSLEEPIMRLF